MLLHTQNNEGWRLNVIIEVCVFSDIELECDDVTNSGKGDWMYEDRIISRKLEGNETAIFNGFQPKIICWTQRSLPSISSYSSIIFYDVHYTALRKFVKPCQFSKLLKIYVKCQQSMLNISCCNVCCYMEVTVPPVRGKLFSAVHTLVYIL